MELPKGVYWQPWNRPFFTSFALGNESYGIGGYVGEAFRVSPTVYPRQITSEVDGQSLWRRIDVTLDDPATGRKSYSWCSSHGTFPDQYCLDRTFVIEATITGYDQGYSGWTELTDGGVFFVNYTDDTAPACRFNDHNFGVP